LIQIVICEMANLDIVGVACNLLVFWVQLESNKQHWWLLVFGSWLLVVGSASEM